MKKLLFIIAIIILFILLAIGYFLIVKRSQKTLPSMEIEERLPAVESITPLSPAPPFNTNDNLDEALQELDQLDQFEF